MKAKKEESKVDLQVIETPQEKKKDILVLSPSRVKTFISCPRKYYYTYIKRLTRKDWAHFALGTFCHGVLEQFHKNFKKDADKPNLKKLMTECFKTQIGKDKNLTAEVLLEAKELMSGYLNRIIDFGIGAEILSLEEPFLLSLNSKFSLQGVLDRIDLENDIYHIKDYKTTKSMKYMYDFQLKTYGIYLIGKYPEIDRFRGSYVMLRHSGTLVPYDFNREDVEKSKKQLIEYGEKIQAEGRWSPCQSNLCSWCDFEQTCLSTW